MDVLKLEIERKKRLLQEKKEKKKIKKLKPNSNTDSNEIVSENNSTLSINLDSVNNLIENNELSQSSKMLPKSEVIFRLRERNEPIILFGETEFEINQRLKKVQIMQPEAIKGMRNELQDALEQMNQQCILAISSSESDKLKKYDVPYEVVDKNYEDLLELCGKRVSSEEEANVETDIIIIFLKEFQSSLDEQEDERFEKGADVKLVCKNTLNSRNDGWIKYFKFLAKEWACELNSREEGVKVSAKGKLESAKYTQTLAYLQPLIKRLSENSLGSDIKTFLSQITRFCLQREYIKANEVYLQMAIGNAPWPIGVTMPGIHCRLGRDRIATHSVAHVLNDETQRKYIQAFKRLITFCQKIYSTDPSKCNEYVKTK